MIKEALITEFTVILDGIVFLEEIAAFPSSVEITVALSCGLSELLLAMSVGTQVSIVAFGVLNPSEAEIRLVVTIIVEREGELTQINAFFAKSVDLLSDHLGPLFELLQVLLSRS